MHGRSWVRSIFSLTLSASALGVAAVVLKSAHDVRSTASELPQQLEAAQKEGIPTNPAALAADNLSLPSQNAAPAYDDAIRMLKRISSDDIDLGLKSAVGILEGTADPRAQQVAHVRMMHFGPPLEKALLGSVRKNCAFTPDWNHGSGYPQLKPLSTLGRLLAARAVLDHDLADLFAAVRIANHLSQAPVLEGEQLQTVLVEAICRAAWALAKAQPENALACKTLLEDLPGIRLDHRIAGELQRSLAAIKGLPNSADDPLREFVSLPGSPQVSEAFQTEVVKSLRQIHLLEIHAKSWPDIEDGLSKIEASAKEDPSLAGHVLTVLIGPWAETAHASRRAQERKVTTIRAISLLREKQPAYSDPTRKEIV